ncbi:MAG TPA: cation-transporting P-type ATPase, partial [Opitutaceae bacterium]|nr:cation-transporting P-type ATPase [Opitutaceae bacterium]
MSTMHDTEAARAERGETAPEAAPGIELDSAALLRTWWRIGVAAVVAGQSMVAGLAINLTPPEGAAYWVLHGVLIAAALGVCVLLLPTLVREAWSALRVGRITVEQLFLVTLLGAFAASLAATFTRTGAVYYEVISILLAIYAAGKTLGARSRAKALRAVDETRERYEFAERLDGTRVPVQALALGERVRVRPGGAICVDGVVRAGRSFVQETAMTGEWRPIARGPGDPVLAGTHAIDGELEIEATAAAGARRLDAVLAEVHAARLAPSELQLQADRLATRFLPLVLVVSAGTFAFWTWRAGWIEGVFN